MILPPKCWERKCLHYMGIIQPNNDESIELPYCKVYPDGIPSNITYGNKQCDKLLKAYQVPMDEANDDWIRSARLQRKANAGDEEACQKLDKLFNTPIRGPEPDPDDEDLKEFIKLYPITSRKDKQP